MTVLDDFDNTCDLVSKMVYKMYQEFPIASLDITNLRWLDCHFEGVWFIKHKTNQNNTNISTKTKADSERHTGEKKTSESYAKSVWNRKTSIAFRG